MRRLLWIADSALIVVGVALLLASDGARGFARDNGLFMYVLGLILLVLLAVAVDRYLSVRAKHDVAVSLRLQSEARFPTIRKRDQELFNRIEGEMGRDTPATAYLRSIFNGKSWDWLQMEPYLSFADGWGHNAMFDDPVMEESLRHLHKIASDFYSDGATESSPPDDSDPHLRIAELHSGPHRPQYGTEWNEVRDRLTSKARATAKACDALYVSGRQRGY